MGMIFSVYALSHYTNSRRVPSKVWDQCNNPVLIGLRIHCLIFCRHYYDCFSIINAMAIISAAADALSTGLMAASEMGWLKPTDRDFAVVYIQLVVLVGKCGQENASGRRKEKAKLSPLQLGRSLPSEASIIVAEGHPRLPLEILCTAQTLRSISAARYFVLYHMMCQYINTAVRSARHCLAV